MERSSIRGLQAVARALPDFASLHPGYAVVGAALTPLPGELVLALVAADKHQDAGDQGRTASTSKPVEVWPVASLTQPIR